MMHLPDVERTVPRRPREKPIAQGRRQVLCRQFSSRREYQFHGNGRQRRNQKNSPHQKNPASNGGFRSGPARWSSPREVRLGRFVG
jgi:hypothetical protein